MKRTGGCTDRWHFYYNLDDIVNDKARSYLLTNKEHEDVG